MNIMTRRIARQILHSSYAPANQTLQLDLGWPTMKAEIKLGRIKLGLKLLSPAKDHTIAQDVLQHALTHGTEWTDEVNEDIGDLYGPGKWLRNIEGSQRLHVEQNWLNRDRENQWDRLQNKVMKTTQLYRDLNPRGKPETTAPYIVHNPNKNAAIRTIFKLRSGSSTLRADREARHLADTKICRS